MTEQFLQQIFLRGLYEHIYFFPSSVSETRGDIELISPGVLNLDAGADFFNAKLRIGSLIYAGNIELHLLASDWFRHGHHKDARYNNVILHVVLKNDAQAVTESGQEVLTASLEISPTLSNLESYLNKKSSFPKCSNYLEKVSLRASQACLKELLVERLNSKREMINSYLEFYKGDWDEVAYTLLSRAFGFGVNAEAMECLARSVPLSVLRKHRGNLLQIEALLFGQGALLPQEHSRNSYIASLQREYLFLKTKFNLHFLSRPAFRTGRIRPQNSPYIRIAQFAAVLASDDRFFRKFVSADSIGQLKNIFNAKVSSYWTHSYSFSNSQKISCSKERKLSDSTMCVLIGNIIIPLMYAYAYHQNDMKLKEKAFVFLRQLPLERNRYIEGFLSSGLKLKTMGDSQAIIELKNNYCNKNYCYRCLFFYCFISELDF